MDLLQEMPRDAQVRSCFFSDQQTSEVACVLVDPKELCKFGQYPTVLTSSPEGCPRPRENRYEEDSKVAHDPASLPSSLFYDFGLRNE